MKIDLIQIPEGAIPNDVDVSRVEVSGRSALRLTLSQRAKEGEFGVDHADEPTFLLLPVEFRNGVIEVEMMSRLLPDAPDFARGFIGIAYRVVNVDQGFESVYLRPTNGLKAAPPPPRNGRAIQYFAYPDWKFDRLRQEEPDGPYESGADIALGEWITLRIEVNDLRLLAFVNGRCVLDISKTKLAPAAGRIGLWVDIGTEGFFSDLSVEADS